MGGVWFGWWFGSVQIAFVFFCFSAVVAVGCFGLRCDVSKRKGNVSAYVADVSKRKGNVRAYVAT